jgi:DNA polymerase I-like protein with 3'-5' exonuclease and polymerase domains
MTLEYSNLRWVENDKYTGWLYDFSHMPRTLWGGKLVENIIQSLARIVVMNNMLTIHRELDLRPVLQAHDELVYVVPANETGAYREAIQKIMSTPPEWAPTLPVAVSVKYGETYGDAK